MSRILALVGWLFAVAAGVKLYRQEYHVLSMMVVSFLTITAAEYLRTLGK